MDYFNPYTIGSFLISLAIAYHSIRSGRSPLWLLAIAVASFAGLLATVAVWLGYLFVAVIPDFLRSHGMRRFADNASTAADPGRGYREKKRQVEQVGSVDAKRALAEKASSAACSPKRWRFMKAPCRDHWAGQTRCC